MTLLLTDYTVLNKLQQQQVATLSVAPEQIEFPGRFKQPWRPSRTGLTTP
ncbi:hypothetical protein [Pseudomonas duriflava]|nr:hypothetical protein [Pseudomonas duriflava]